MTFEDPTFWQGAGAAGVTGFVALWVRRIAKVESLEERLQRWQESTVAQVKAENAALRAEIGTLKDLSACVPVLEACLRLAVDALHRIAPESPELRQIGALLSRAMPIDTSLPSDMREMLSRIKRKGEK